MPCIVVLHKAQAFTFDTITNDCVWFSFVALSDCYCCFDSINVMSADFLCMPSESSEAICNVVLSYSEIYALVRLPSVTVNEYYQIVKLTASCHIHAFPANTFLKLSTYNIGEIIFFLDLGCCCHSCSDCNSVSKRTRCHIDSFGAVH